MSCKEHWCRCLACHALTCKLCSSDMGPSQGRQGRVGLVQGVAQGLQQAQPRTVRAQGWERQAASGHDLQPGLILSANCEDKPNILASSLRSAI